MEQGASLGLPRKCGMVADGAPNMWPMINHEFLGGILFSDKPQ